MPGLELMLGWNRQYPKILQYRICDESKQSDKEKAGEDCSYSLKDDHSSTPSSIWCKDPTDCYMLPGQGSSRVKLFKPSAAQLCIELNVHQNSNLPLEN